MSDGAAEDNTADHGPSLAEHAGDVGDNHRDDAGAEPSVVSASIDRDGAAEDGNSKDHRLSPEHIEDGDNNGGSDGAGPSDNGLTMTVGALGLATAVWGTSHFSSGVGKAPVPVGDGDGDGERAVQQSECEQQFRRCHFSDDATTEILCRMMSLFFASGIFTWGIAGFFIHRRYKKLQREHQHMQEFSY